MEKLLKTREAYGLSQADVAKTLGMPQPTYASYETGKTQRVPTDFLKKFAYQYHILEGWLLGADVPNIQLQNDTVFQRIADHINKVAERLRLPETFLRAVCDGDLMPSLELYKAMIMASDPNSDSQAKTPPIGQSNPAALQAENQELRAENRRLTQTIDHLNKYILLLEEKQGK